MLVPLLRALVAHRPWAVARADRVAFLAGGRIVAQGTHAELLRHDPGYAAFWSATTSDALPG